MKYILFIHFFVAFSVLVKGQVNPTCSQLMVEEISMLTDSTMKLTIRNSCISCSAAGYCNLIVLHLSTDTIAQTKCACLWTPHNDSIRTYILPATVSTIPPINQLKIGYVCDACDSIPISPLLGFHETTNLVGPMVVYPNPAYEGRIQLKLTETGIGEIQLIDVVGKVIASKKTKQSEYIDFENIRSGMYYVIATQQKYYVKVMVY